MAKDNSVQNDAVAGKKQALQNVLTSIEKQFGKGSIMKFSDDSPLPEVDFISSGSLKVDTITGGGFPRGRIVEIYGPESSGKTTLCLSTVAQAQKLGLQCAYVDAENALDIVYAKKLGVDLNTLLISQPDYGEQALEITDSLVASAAVDVIVIDSVAALTPKTEIEGEMGDSHMGLQARMMSQGLRKLTAMAKKNNVLLIFINQIRQKIGVTWGSNEVTTGGNALKFYASMRIDIRRIGSIKKGEDAVGNEVKIKTVKNKVFPPFKEATTELMFGEGFNLIGEIVDLAVEKGIVTKSGAWYAYNDSKIGQGKDNSCSYLKDNQIIFDEIKTKVMAPEQK